MAFNLDDYEPVASRVQRFYDAYPTGAIHCKIVHDDGQRIVIEATVWRDINDTRPAAVDYAEELLTDRGVNSTSRIENCATSATGRAISIAAAGLGSSDWTKKPSREEMQKAARDYVERRETIKQGDVTIERPANLASDKQRNMIRAIHKKLGTPPPHWLDTATKQQASTEIDRLKALEAAGPRQGDHLTVVEDQELRQADAYDQEEPF